jgi:hypothetical protein
VLACIVLCPNSSFCFVDHMFGLSALGECQADIALDFIGLLGMKGSAHTFLRNAGEEWWLTLINGCKAVRHLSSPSTTVPVHPYLALQLFVLDGRAPKLCPQEVLL